MSSWLLCNCTGNSKVCVGAVRTGILGNVFGLVVDKYVFYLFLK